MGIKLPTAVEPWLWPAFIGGVLFLLFFDLFILRKKFQAMSRRQAIHWSVFWIGLSLAFTAWFTLRYGLKLGIPFLTGYLVEQSLSVDNLFVIFLIFQSFRIPSKYQHRVLFWGILGAIVFRGILIVLGVDLIHRFDWLMYVFGAILLMTGIKFLFETDEKQDVTESWLVKFTRKHLRLTKELHGERFFFIEDGIRKATPLFLALVVIEVTDIVFAVDSIPAVLSVTDDAFVAFASNILAILGLRSLYFVIADLVARLRYLKPGLAVILGYIGVKMLVSHFYKVPPWVSLMVISGVLLTAGLTSWYVARKK